MIFCVRNSFQACAHIFIFLRYDIAASHSDSRKVGEGNSRRGGEDVGEYGKRCWGEGGKGGTRERERG